MAHGAPHEVDVQLYAVEPHHAADDGAGHPILLSYLDTVVQGYLREFGTRGARRFFDTTDGGEMTVLDDRAAPVYPRAQSLRPEETRFVDDALARLGVAITTDA